MRRLPQGLLLGTLALVAAQGCRTQGGSAVEGSDAVVAAAGPHGVEAAGERAGHAGYFVAVSARSPTPAVVALHDRLYGALDAYNRKKAQGAGTLETYAEEFDATGTTSLVVGDDEIECDRDRCLLKLTGRELSAPDGKPGGSLAIELTSALEVGGIKPRVEGARRVYALGDVKSVGLACEQAHGASSATYTCRFNVDGAPAGDAAAAATAAPERGRLSSCSLSPGVVRVAEEARDGIDGGGLLKLAGGPSDAARATGFLRYARAARGVELLDVFLCGDVSHDSLRLGPGARDPRAWVAKPVRIGATATPEPARQDEAEMRLAATVVGVTRDTYTLEVRFQLVPDAGTTSVEVYGEDRFFVKLARAWVD